MKKDSVYVVFDRKKKVVDEGEGTVDCPLKGKLSELAKENLELSLDNPKQLKIFSVSQPDSALPH